MDAIQKAVGELPSPIKSEAISILDAYEARGISEKTRQACINMIRKGFDNPMICEVLEVSEEYVDEVRERLEGERLED
jgi:hypothetical protein